jgi:hypothetical protein
MSTLSDDRETDFGDDEDGSVDSIDLALAALADDLQPSELPHHDQVWFDDLVDRMEASTLKSQISSSTLHGADAGGAAAATGGGGGGGGGGSGGGGGGGEVSGGGGGAGAAGVRSGKSPLPNLDPDNTSFFEMMAASKSCSPAQTPVSPKIEVDSEGPSRVGTDTSENSDALGVALAAAAAAGAAAAAAAFEPRGAARADTQSTHT